MSKPANKTLIGVFVVIALVLVVGAVVVLGSGKFFKNYPKFVMYFQGSVKGLAVGAPVNFRGVKVGSVTDIKMLLNPKNLSIMIPVYVEVYPEAVEAVGPEGAAALRKGAGHGEMVPELVKHGLRAQLEMQSIVTGQLAVSLDLYPDKPAVFVHADPKTPEIPTIPTPLQELAKRVEKIPIEEIFTKLDDTLTGIQKLINSPEAGAIMKSVRQTVDETRSLVQNVNSQVGPMSERVAAIVEHAHGLAEQLQAQIGPLTASITKTSDEASATLKRAQGTMETIDNAAGEDSMVAYRLQKTLDELSAAARSMRLLTDTLQHQPESLIYGKKNRGGEVR